MFLLIITNYFKIWQNDHLLGSIVFRRTIIHSGLIVIGRDSIMESHVHFGLITCVFHFYLEPKSLIVLFYKHFKMSFSDINYEENFSKLHVHLYNFGRTNPYIYTNIKTNIIDYLQLSFVVTRCMVK